MRCTQSLDFLVNLYKVGVALVDDHVELSLVGFLAYHPTVATCLHDRLAVINSAEIRRKAKVRKMFPLYCISVIRLLASNWVSKIGNCRIFGHPIFHGRPQYTQILNLNMYLLIGIRHNIFTKRHGSYIELKKKIK